MKNNLLIQRISIHFNNELCHYLMKYNINKKNCCLHKITNRVTVEIGQ